MLAKPPTREKIGNFIIYSVLNYPLWILLFFLIMTAFLAFFAFRVERDSSLDNLLPSDSGTSLEQDRLEALFKIREPVIVGLQFNEPLSKEDVLQLIDRLSQRLENDSQEYQLQDVKSITRIKDLVKIDEVGLESIHLYQHYQTLQKEKGEQEASLWFESYLRNNPILQGVLVSKDLMSSFIIIEASFDDSETDPAVQLYQYLKRLLNEEKTDVLASYDIAGSLISVAVIDASMSRDLNILIIVASLILALILWLYFHSLHGVILPLVEVLVSLVWTFGLMSLLGEKLSIVAIALPAILMAVGIADDLYFLIEFNHHYQKKSEKRIAIKKTMKQLLAPHLMTSLTTAVGFLSFAFSPLDSVVQFGLFTAFGVVVTLAFSTLALPAIIALLPLKPSTKKMQRLSLQNFIMKIVTLLQKRRARFLALFTVLFLLISAIWGLQVRFSSIELFKKNHPLRLADSHLNTYSVGTSTFYLHFSSQEEGILNSSLFLQKMSELQQRLSTDQNVGKSISLADYVKRINFLFNDVSSLPQKDNDLGQLLFLYEILDLSLLEDVTTTNFHDFNMTVHLRATHSLAFKKTRKIIKDFMLKEIKPIWGAKIELKISGSGNYTIEIIDSIVASQLLGIPLVILVLFVFLLFMFRSFTASLIAMIPLLSSLMSLFGMQALFKIPLNLITGLLSGIVAGLGIDYSIHLLGMLERWRRQSLLTKQVDAQERHKIVFIVAQAVLLNALSLAAGFLTLLASGFLGLQQLGLLLALSMLLTALYVIIFIPAFYKKAPKSLLLLFGKEK